MHLVEGNIWDERGRADLILVTINKIVKANGELVMGGGAAGQAARLFPDLPLALGRVIKTRNNPYGIVLAGFVETGPKGSEIGGFQTKAHFRDPSTLGLIQFSVRHLIEIAPRYRRIALNYPGIGLGGLSKEEVWPYIERLPDNVYVYHSG